MTVGPDPLFSHLLPSFSPICLNDDDKPWGSAQNPQTFLLELCNYMLTYTMQFVAWTNKRNSILQVWFWLYDKWYFVAQTGLESHMNGSADWESGKRDVAEYKCEKTSFVLNGECCLNAVWRDCVDVTLCPLSDHLIMGHWLWPSWMASGIHSFCTRQD